MRNLGCRDEQYFDFSKINGSILKLLKCGVNGSREAQDHRGSSDPSSADEKGSLLHYLSHRYGILA